MPAHAPIAFKCWAGFILIILFLLGVDLGVIHRSSRDIKPREALLWSAFWFLLAMLFAGGLVFWRGTGEALEFVTGYFVEFSLSLDNVIAIALIFSMFGVAPQYRHRLLSLGVIGAIAMRGAMIVLGVTLLRKFRWTLYLMGAFLILTGAKWGFSKQRPGQPADNPVLRFARKVAHVPSKYDGGMVVAPLALVLLMVEVMDLVFAVDSIPAIFGVTQNAFIVFTSNIFAILGLRSLYFAVSGAIQSFRFLKGGLAVVLIFVGAKMLASPWRTIPTDLSLVVVAAIITVSAGFSFFTTRQEKKA